MLVLDSISEVFSDIGTILRVSSADKPRVKPKFGDESASIPIVFSPRSTKPRARPPAMRVLPTPPLPATAIFITVTNYPRHAFAKLIYVSTDNSRLT